MENEYTNQGEISPMGNDLNQRLETEGLTITDQNRYTLQRRDLVSQIRRSRRNSSLVYSRDEPKISHFGMTEIKDRVNFINYNNRKIEDAVKREILGVKNDALSKILYWLKNSSGKQIQPAEAIIQDQIERVNQTCNEIDTYRNNLDYRIENLEKHYDTIYCKVISKHKDAELLRKDVEVKRQLLEKTEDAVQKSGNIRERTSYSYSSRKIRDELQKNIHKITLNNRSLIMLNQEMPVLDNLKSICTAYSYSILEVVQECQLMKDHLENVMSLYLDMLRSQNSKINLESEVRKLFSYTGNMTNAIRNGETDIIKRANEDGLLEREFNTNSLNLEKTLTRIEDATFNRFSQLESRLGEYSNQIDLKGGR